MRWQPFFVALCVQLFVLAAIGLLVLMVVKSLHGLEAGL